jgi:hypothetical protein
MVYRLLVVMHTERTLRYLVIKHNFSGVVHIEAFKGKT